MTVGICDRCGGVTVAPEPCRCASPCDPVVVHRRHRDAMDLAQDTSTSTPARSRDARRAA